jgi:hypothetical protein
MPDWYGGSTLNPSHITPLQEQWRDQWERSLRWYERVRQIEQKSLKQELDIGDIDVVIAFFQNCYHVRDWIVASRPSLKKQMDNFFHTHFEMGACRDICNGFKHKDLDHWTHDKDFNLYRECDHLAAMGTGKKSPVRHRAVFADGTGIRKFDLFVLADSCIDLWNQFLRENGLDVIAK